MWFAMNKFISYKYNNFKGALISISTRNSILFYNGRYNYFVSTTLRKKIHAVGWVVYWAASMGMATKVKHYSVIWIRLSLPRHQYETMNSFFGLLNRFQMTFIPVREHWKKMRQTCFKFYMANDKSYVWYLWLGFYINWIYYESICWKRVACFETIICFIYVSHRCKNHYMFHICIPQMQSTKLSGSDLIQWGLS